MKIRTMFTISAVLFVVLGVLMYFSDVLLGTAAIALALSAELSAEAIYLARAGGSVAIGMGVMAWLMRASGPSPERDAVVVGFVVSNILAPIATLIALLDGTAPPSAWVGLILNVLVALGFYLTGWPGRATE